MQAALPPVAYVLYEQYLQVELLVWPVLAEYLPAGQAVHKVSQLPP